jgi:hypothetical protein
VITREEFFKALAVTAILMATVDTVTLTSFKLVQDHNWSWACVTAPLWGLGMISWIALLLGWVRRRFGR